MLGRRNNPGFTLIELMIVVAVISVLAAVAIMSYSVYQRRAKAGEVTEMLSAVYAAQESFRGVAGRFQNAGWCPPNAPVGGEDLPFADCAEADLRAWRELGITLPRETVFTYRVFAWGPGTGNTECGPPGNPGERAWVLDDLDPCDLDGNDDNSGWYALALGDQTGNGTTAQFATTHALRGRVIRLRDAQ